MDLSKHPQIFLSDGFLGRHNVSLNKPTDTCFFGLLELFRDKFISRKEEIRKKIDMRDSSGLDDEELTYDVTVSDLGLDESHAEKVEGYLKEIHDYPIYIPEEILGKETYTRLHLLSNYTPLPYNGKGKKTWRVVFNKLLALHVFPEKAFGKCDLSVREEIKSRSLVSALFYEYGCQSQFYRPSRDGYYFEMTEKEIRTKLRFDVFQKDGSVITIRNVRWDNIVYRYIEPALEIIEEFFNAGKIAFWLSKKDLSVFSKSNGKVGAPKKARRGYRFYLEREPRNHQSSVQVILTNDVRVAIYNFTKEISWILQEGGFRSYGRYTELVEKQILEKISDCPDILEKAINKVDEKRNLCLREKKTATDFSHLVRLSLWDIGLGEPVTKADASLAADADSIWPIDKDEQVNVMRSQPEKVLEYLQAHGFCEAEKDNCLVGFRRALNNPSKNMVSEDAIWKYFNNWLGYERKNINEKNNGTGNSNNVSPGEAVFIRKLGQKC